MSKVFVNGGYNELPPDATYVLDSQEIVQSPHAEPSARELGKCAVPKIVEWGPADARNARDIDIETPRDLSYSA